MELEVTDWIHLAQDVVQEQILVNKRMNLEDLFLLGFNVV
jgi:hypothetical protein